MRVVYEQGEPVVLMTYSEEEHIKELVSNNDYEGVIKIISSMLTAVFSAAW
jgi:hypothetical protein